MGMEKSLSAEQIKKKEKGLPGDKICQSFLILAAAYTVKLILKIIFFITQSASVL